VFAERSGQYVMLDRPRLVIKEIRRVVDAVAGRSAALNEFDAGPRRTQ